VILHRGANKIIIPMLVLAAIDLITHRLWLIMLYLSGWSIVLFRNSNRVGRTDCITSPVSGTVSRVFRTNIDSKEMECIKIDTKPVLHSQTYRVISSEDIDSVKFSHEYKTVNYKSGLIVKHSAWLGFHKQFNEIESDTVYGHSYLGGTTIIALPNGMKSTIIEGQRVIDGETIIGGKAS
jgi:hypothetical protein